MARRTLLLGDRPGIHWEALRTVDTCLYRRMADHGRELLAIGVREQVDEPVFGTHGVVADWTFGLLAYDHRETLGEAPSRHPDEGLFPCSHWWVPRFVLERSREGWSLHAMPGDEQDGIALADELLPAVLHGAPPPPRALEWTCRTSRATYLDRAADLLAHIRRGDIYELNYCMRFAAHDPHFDPCTSFGTLLRNSDAPFAALLKLEDRWALCASPERFLAFDGARVIAQPMKGTRPRGVDAASDALLRAELAADAKERAENIMAVDVTRHDLSRTTVPGSVRVEELCAVRSLPRVHQLVSTVAGTLAEGRDPWQVVEAAFPMASMTGAPKIRAMELIDAAEDQRRGLYSGTLGFFAPDGTGDLNVVIRTVLFDARTGDLSLHAGSALTATCDPLREHAECLLKARSVFNALGHAG